MAWLNRTQKVLFALPKPTVHLGSGITVGCASGIHQLGCPSIVSPAAAFNGARFLQRSTPMFKPSNDEETKKAVDTGFLSKERMIAPEGFNRWLAVPPVLALKVSLGSIYAWSVFNRPLISDIGVVAPCSTDWALADVVPIFSTTAAIFGVSVWGLGKFIENIGARKSAVLAAGCFGSGMAIAGVGVEMHSLPLLYGGYGVLGGLGFALGYIAPIGNLVRWFPDKKGLVTGTAMSAFGGGALFCAPFSEWMMKQNQSAPTYVGNVNDMELVSETGRKFAHFGDEIKEVVVASTKSIEQMPGLEEGGIYLAGTGSTGLGVTFMTLGAIYGSLMLTGALTQRSPGSVSSGPVQNANEPYVPVETTTKIPQFYMMWLATMGNAMAGITILSCAKTMMSDIYGSALPLYVDGAFAASFVAGLSLANLGGRLGWASFSDVVGRKKVLLSFGALGVPICLAIPQMTASLANDPSTASLWAFVGGTSVLISCYGGLLGVLPAYVSDTFGAKNQTSIFGRAMTGWATAALIGPKVMTYLREQEYTAAIKQLAAKTDPAKFSESFGATLDQLPELIEAKSVTIPQLLAICPQGVSDPTIALYDSTLYTMAGVLGAAMVLNLMINPVDKKFMVTDGGDSSTQSPK